MGEVGVDINVTPAMIKHISFFFVQRRFNIKYGNSVERESMVS
jgi:hypothetical protein